MSAILGSGMIAFGLIPPLCILSSARFEMKFKILPILRECGFYMFGLLMFFFTIGDGRVATNEALITIGSKLIHFLLSLCLIPFLY